VSKVSCTACKNSGHDNNSKPVVKFEMREQPDGTEKREHVTVKQGSGCLNCCGLGYKEK
jgi:hypothetical protein